MTFDGLKPLAYQLMGERKAHLSREKGGIYCHGERVAKTVVSLRKLVLPHDSSWDERLKIAALFHDIGKGVEPHEKYGPVIAREALKPFFGAAELDEICDLIARHCARSPENNDYSDYLKLLQDADMLDHFGTYNIWTDFWYSAYTERTLVNTAFYESDHWNNECKKNRSLLNYDISKSIFDEKITFINNFYIRLQAECKGEIYDLG